MGLFVDTTGVSVDLDELGISLTHPTTDFDLAGKFSARALAEAASLTSAITGGSLNWKKTAAGPIEVAGDYDPDIVLADEANLGTGEFGDRLVSFKDLTGDNLTGASPGFSFGDSGNVVNGYLLNESVPSNKVGRLVMLNNAKIVTVAAVNENQTNDWEAEIYEHDGTTFILKHTITVLAANRGQIDEGLSVSLTKGKELAAKISGLGSAKNPLVTVIVKGDS
jgi:hypothetical protein